MNKYLEKLGEPDFKLSSLSIWIHGREFPEHEDYWDGNWIRVTIYCTAPGSNVIVEDLYIHVSELSSWFEQLQKIYSTLEGEAGLSCIEPYL